MTDGAFSARPDHARDGNNIPAGRVVDFERSSTGDRTHLETEMEGGNVRVRRRPAGRLPLIQWGRYLNPTEMAAFRTFVETTLFDGTSRFTMQVSLGGGAYESRTVQIQSGSLKWAAIGGNEGHVTFSLYVFPASVTS